MCALLCDSAPWVPADAGSHVTGAAAAPHDIGITVAVNRQSNEGFRFAESSGFAGRVR